MPSFDPTQPFQVVGGTQGQTFDPSRPFQLVNSSNPPPIDIDKLLASRPSVSPLDGISKSIQSKDSAAAALDQPFSEVQPSGQIKQRAVNTDPEANQAELAKATKQLVNYQIPIKKGDSVVSAAGKEAVNLLMGIPEFMTSPAGVASIPFGAALPRTAAAIFGGDAIKNAGQSVISAHSNWNDLSPAEKTKAVVDIAGNIGFAGLLGHGAAKGAPEVPKPIKPASNAPMTPEAIVRPDQPTAPDAFQTPPSVTPLPTAEAGKPNPIPIQQVPQKLAPQDLQPALLVDGKPLTGGETHRDIYNGIADPDLKDKAFDALTDEAKHVFVDKAGNVLNREQAAKALGESKPLQSERLNELKESSGTKPPESGTKPPEPAVQPQPVPPKPAEPPQPTTPAPSETTGIAHRVSEARGVAAERGVGTSPEELVQKGRDLLTKGADPEKIISDFEADPKKAISDSGMGVLRAHQEKLAQAADAAADKFGINSPEYKAANEADRAWVSRIKPYQSQWSEIGRGQQGETDLDTGSFTAMAREFESQTQKKPTPVQSKRLKQNADAVRKADSDTQKAIKTVLDTVERETPAPKAKGIAQRVYDALDKQSKDALARLNARRAAASSGLTPQDVADYAILGASQIAKGIIKFPEWSKAMIDQFGDVIKPHLDRIYDAATEKHLDEIRNQFGEVKKGEPFTPDQVKTLWKYAKDHYITDGEVNFAKIANWLSVDFGIPKRDVARALIQSPATKRALDDAYVKQYRARQLKNAAKAYLKQEATPNLVRKVQSIPRALFNLAVFGHGTTWIGTHAGQLLYDPTQLKSIGKNYAKMWQVAFSPKEWEKESQELVSRPNWTTARRAGLNNDPYVRQGDYDTPELTAWMKALGVGKRGALGLLTLRQDYFDTVWDNIPPTERTKEMAKYVADLTNHATGTTRAKVVENPWTSLFLFAPRLVASRFQWDVTDPMKAALIKGFGLLGKKPTPEEKMFANHVIKKRAIFAATILSALGLNQIVLNATGSKQQVNFFHPHKSDWLRFKGFGMEAAPFSAGISVLRLLTQEYSDFFVNNQKKKGLPFNPAEQAGTDALRYARAELSPFASHGLDLMSQSDFEGRPLPALPFRNPPPKEPAFLKKEGVKPYTWTQYALTTAPIPFEAAIQEGFQSQGMSESAASKWTKILLGSAAMAATGVMVKEDPESHPASTFEWKR